MIQCRFSLGRSLPPELSELRALTASGLTITPAQPPPHVSIQIPTYLPLFTEMHIPTYLLIMKHIQSTTYILRWLKQKSHLKLQKIGKKTTCVAHDHETFHELSSGIKDV